MLIHISRARRIAGAILCTFVLGKVAGAQAIAVPAPPVKIQIVISSTGAVGKLTSEAVSAETNSFGKLSADLKGPEPLIPAGCVFSDAALEASIHHALSPGPLTAKTIIERNVGTKVEGTLSPQTEGRFRANLTIVVRSLTGCRQVGNLVIPVFSNRTFDKDTMVASGELLEIAETLEGNPMKITLTFTTSIDGVNR